MPHNEPTIAAVRLPSQRSLSSALCALGIVVAGCGPTATAPTESPIVAATATPTTTPTTTAIASTAPTATTTPTAATNPPFVNSTYKFSVVLPAPYRWTSRLSFADRGGKQPAQDAFTARTPDDEVISGQGCGQTVCAIWNYVAVVEVWPDEASTGAPREWYQRYSFSRGERIQEVTVDGRPAVRIDGGATYPVQYIIRDGARVFRFAYMIYSPDFGPTPPGASREKLEQILASFRFTQ